MRRQVMITSALVLCLLTGCGNAAGMGNTGGTDSVAEETASSAGGSTGKTASAEAASTSGNSSEAGAVENVYFALEGDPFNIVGTDACSFSLRAAEGWSFTVTDDTDVTSWLVDQNGNPAFTDTKGIAYASLSDGASGDEKNCLTITIDASKITGFTGNGVTDVYVRPSSDSMWVAGDNHGFYNEVSECCGKYTIPAVSVPDMIEAETGPDGYAFTNDSADIVLSMDGLDDSLIDSSGASVKIAPGDGYYVEDFDFVPGTLGTDWTDGKTQYTMHEGDITFNNGGYPVSKGGRSGFANLGGDGNGNSIVRIELSGLKYNGLPLSSSIIKYHEYVYGRTFNVEGGSLIADTQPDFSSDAENGIPVLCDPYPDELTVKWPIGYDASALTDGDITITLKSDYGDELTLTAGKDFTITTGADKTDITVSYINWANTPVYKKLTVDVATDHISIDNEMYHAAADISYDYDIASVYAYYNLSGGMEGVLTYSYYGIEGFKEWSQLYKAPYYYLTVTDGNGNKSYYSEKDGKVSLVSSEEEATSFDATEELDPQVINNVAYITRGGSDVTQEKKVDGKTITFTKEYCNVEYLLKDVKDAEGITTADGYVIGDTWEMHGRWPWQSFINEGYQGGTK